MIGGAVLQPHLARRVEQHVDDGPLRRREQHLVDERLALVPTAVTADQLGAGAWKGEVEDPRVRGVDQVQAHDLAGGRLAGELGLAVDQHDVAESTHRGEGRARLAERRDVPVLDEQVVQGDGQLPVDGRPVRGSAGSTTIVPYRPISSPKSSRMCGWYQ